MAQSDWTADAAKGAMVLDLVRTLPGRPCSVLLSMCTFQHALNKCSSDHTGILENTADLLDKIVGALGVCETVLFVGAGLGHVEYALSELMKLVVAAKPEKYRGVANFRTVITDGGLGANAPPAGVLPRFVLPLTATDAIEKFGGVGTAVLCIKPDPESPRAEATRLAEAAAATGCPFVGVWMETPTAGLDDVSKLQAETAVVKFNGKGLSALEQQAVESYVIDDDGFPKSDLTRHDWEALNRHFILYYITEEHTHDVPRMQSSKTMAWLCWVLRPPKSCPALAVEPARLPVLDGDRLRAMVTRYAAMLLK